MQIRLIHFQQDWQTPNVASWQWTVVAASGVIETQGWATTEEDAKLSAIAYAALFIPEDELHAWLGDVHEAPWYCADCGYMDCRCIALEGIPASTQQEYAEWLAEQALAQWDDDPNPYHGDYSEM